MAHITMTKCTQENFLLQKNQLDKSLKNINEDAYEDSQSHHSLLHQDENCDSYEPLQY